MTQLTEQEVAELRIRSLLTRERYYRDTAQWENLRNSYHPDASKTYIKITWFEGTADGFVAGSEKMARAGSNSSHTISPTVIHFNYDMSKAVSESNGSINSRFEHEGNDYDCASFARFISRLENVNGEWKMLTLEAIYDRDTISTALPIKSPAQFDMKGHRASYRCIGWLLSRKGFQVNRDLPGTDRPETVSSFMEGSFNWLNSM